MRCLMISVGLLVAAHAAEEKNELPEVKEVIDARVATLPEPKAPALGEGVTMAITSVSEKAQKHFQQGMNCLHTGWDFEAYRHFCAALKEDPECLMAHWGVVVALLQGDLESADEREAAMARMLHLANQEVGTDLERRYVFALIKLLEGGPKSAANAFSQMVEDYPNDPQARLMRALFGRGGYDELGFVTPDQESAEKELRELVEKYPDASYLKYALLAIRAEAPSLKQDLGLARSLAESFPDYGPYQHVLGHYEWRCGNPGRAAKAFGLASDFYQSWIDAEGLTVLDCPQWTKSASYRAVALSSKGDYEAALELAKELAAIEVPALEAGRKGARMLLWEAKTLPVRILMRRSGAGDMKLATSLLPKKAAVGGFGDKTLVVWSYQAYSSLVSGRLAIEAGDLDAARAISADITQLGENLVKLQELAVGAGERSEYFRLFRSLEVMASELRGLVAMAGPKKDRGSALNWFRSAVDRQTLATLMMPPAVLLPMEVRLGEYFLDKGEWQASVDELMEGREIWPGDWELLNHLQIVFAKEGLDDRVKEVGSRIEKLLEE